ncbi:hypothetical protein [Terrisporobacter petrolearius]|uniref:hypothetical protein n=1 Tax=Terrisporobacter petrolearius TaxID=1460447 RepID=UPI001A8D9D6A|nr:hypothetical protein [Terrisporobacter petrolearius]MBN9647754.1 hypothetical protein [Terrisporobacter glycolicus]
MEININKIVDIYSQKLVNSERENVLLQAQVLAFEEIIKEKDTRLKELEKQLKDKYKVKDDKN